jgi:hypothetical protein
MKFVKASCEERDRLEAAYQTALQATREIELRLSEDLVSSDLNVKRLAKNELERAQRRSSHVLEELSAHGKKHRCVERKT